MGRRSIFEKSSQYMRRMRKESYVMHPQTRFVEPTIIPEAKMAYPALRDSGAYICDTRMLSNLVCKMIATMTPYIATASQKITLHNHKHLINLKFNYRQTNFPITKCETLHLKD